MILTRFSHDVAILSVEQPYVDGHAISAESRTVIYLDHNATTAPLPEVRSAIWPYLEREWGNPSSVHSFGRRAAAAIEQARQHVAALVGCITEEVIFTSGATEANNTAILSAAMNDPEKRHIVSTQVEHSSVLRRLERLERQGFEVTYLPVGYSGELEPAAVAHAIRADTSLVSVMWANNETGVISPLREIAQLCRNSGVLLHCDAVQAAGKVDIDFGSLGIEYLTLSGHKLGAPKGVGALICRRGASFDSLLLGGEQENGRRGGTESVLSIVGFGEACSVALTRSPGAWQRVSVLRDYLEARLRRRLPDVYFNGNGAARLPNTTNFGIPGIDADAIVAYMDRNDVCVSSGSACLEQSLSPSHVVLAMTNDHRRANEALRVSLGIDNTKEEVDRFFDLLGTLVAALR